MATATQERTFRIAIAKDKLRAHLLLKDAAPETVFRDAIVGKLEELSIPVTPEIAQRVDQAVTGFKAGKIPDEPILLVEGKAPIPAAPARFELTPLDEAPDADGVPSSTDFHRSQIVTVEKGEEFGAFIAATDPVPGVDVHGQPIAPPPPPPPFELGNNIALADDHKTARALITGKVHLNSTSADLIEIVEIPEDVDFSTGDIDTPTNILINGTIRDTFNVKSAKTITVRKAIEAAHVEAGGDIQVNGGIAARHEGKVVSAGEIFTKFCNEADLRAEGNITIAREAINSRIHTRGHLRLARGALIGGYTFAHKGAEINIVGSDAGIESIIALGVDPKDLLRIAEIDEAARKKKRAIEKILATVQPLLAQFKCLTPQQREKATRLIYRADEMKRQLNDGQALKKKLLARPEDVDEVGLTVNQLMHSGAKVILGDQMTTFRKERRGHFRVCRRVVDRVEQIVIVDLASGSVTLQQTYEFLPEELPEELLAETPEAAAD